MKLCVFFIFAVLPWIALVGDWALQWTENSENLQVAFVMFVFPLIMNALQYYIIDSFIKDRNADGGDGEGGGGRDGGEEADESREPLRQGGGRGDDGGDDDDDDEESLGTGARESQRSSAEQKRSADSDASTTTPATAAPSMPVVDKNGSMVESTKVK